MISDALADIRVAVAAARGLLDTGGLEESTLRRLLDVIENNAAHVHDLVVADPPLPTGMTALRVMSHAETIAAHAQRLNLTVVEGGRP